MSHFEQHVSSALGEAARLTRERLDTSLGLLVEREVDDMRTTFLVGLSEREPALSTGVTEYLDAVAECMRTAHENPEHASAPTLRPEVVAELER